MDERRRKSIVLTLVVSSGFLAFLFLLFCFIGSSKPATPAVPNPNGYDDFVRAAQLLIGAPRDYGSMAFDELRGLVTTNREVLHLVNQGLNRQCRVALDFVNTNAADHLKTLSELKRVGQLMAAQGWLAQLEGRTNDAVSSYLDTIRFGQECSRGGPGIDRVVGIASESMGVTALRQLAGNLDAKRSREAAKALEKIHHHRPPLADTLNTEKQLFLSYSTLFQRIRARIPIPAINPTRTYYQSLTIKARAIEFQTKQLLIELAAHAYKLEHGRSPSSLLALVPSYLSAVPIDPETGTSMDFLPMQTRRKESGGEDMR
jgi:hypothetical protein